MVGPKGTQTRAVGIMIDKIHPYIQFSSNRVSMKNVQGCISSNIIPTTLVCAPFGPTIPTYFFNLLWVELVALQWSRIHAACRCTVWRLDCPG